MEKDLKKGERGLFTGGPAPTNRPSQRSQPGPRARAFPLLPLAATTTPRAPERVRAATPRGRHACPTGATTSPSPATTPSTLAFSPAPQCSPLHSLWPSPSPERQWPSARPPMELPSLFRPIPSTPPPLSASFLLSELRIRLAILGRHLPAQVSLPRALNRSSECAGPCRSSPQRQCSRFLPS